MVWNGKGCRTEMQIWWNIYFFNQNGFLCTNSHLCCSNLLTAPSCVTVRTCQLGRWMILQFMLYIFLQTYYCIWQWVCTFLSRPKKKKNPFHSFLDRLLEQIYHGAFLLIFISLIYSAQKQKYHESLGNKLFWNSCCETQEIHAVKSNDLLNLFIGWDEQGWFYFILLVCTVWEMPESGGPQHGYRPHLHSCFLTFFFFLLCL